MWCAYVCIVKFKLPPLYEKQINSINILILYAFRFISELDKNIIVFIALFDTYIRTAHFSRHRIPKSNFIR